MIGENINKTIDKLSEEVIENLKKEIYGRGVTSKSLSEYSTKKLVEELSKREGVKEYQSDMGGYYEIKTTNVFNETEDIIHRKSDGPAIILEIID